MIDDGNWLVVACLIIWVVGGFLSLKKNWTKTDKIINLLLIAFWAIPQAIQIAVTGK